MEDRVSTALKSERGEANHHCDTLSLQPHLFILSAATRNWGQYVDALHQKVLKLEEKAFSSSVDTVCLEDYAILFEDIQNLASLSDMLSMAKAVITGQMNVLSKCTHLQTVLHKELSKKCDCDTENTLRMLKADLQHHYNEVVNLTKTSSMTTQLLYAILRSRATDKLQASVATIHTSIVSLQLQSEQTCQDTANLLKISSEGVKDATIVKILAQTATMFLPASLIAVSASMDYHTEL
ncbi:hypothetical protein NLG97_g6577 [Lecanicillium saksenae]|uniref:Uncharacterized protein n=1 Tax=Lecanicillium saksenae TaxID=468837 RepID=A0ACC1QR35_9HYPO|nr:hypothetical protein NLG97_g6577 [Lecanicillium saksenae]